ncbi:MAG: thioredoxin fold domain-containing protein [Bacteroidales bacterium]|nr:thioredoxin fold domain-containing protein [Bacteroidales bacterium]MCF8390666.1 thioredoxin fold domain-containing protein [Bacteroidales bacterium]
MIKKVLPWFVFVGLILLIIVGLASKDKLNQYLSDLMVKNTAPAIMDRGDEYIDSAYNYLANGLNYKITFLEFGATGCVACRNMENVMEEIKQQYPNIVNVVFLNILKPENQTLMKYYGIAAIPTQVLLNTEGKEFFRHTGYIETRELIINFKLNH